MITVPGRFARWRAGVVVRQVLARQLDLRLVHVAWYVGLLGLYGVAEWILAAWWLAWLASSVFVLLLILVALRRLGGALAVRRVQVWWGGSPSQRGAALFASSVALQRMGPTLKQQRAVMAVLPPASDETLQYLVKLFLRDPQASQDWNTVRARALFLLALAASPTVGDTVSALRSTGHDRGDADAVLQRLSRLDSELNGDVQRSRLLAGLADSWRGSLGELVAAVRALS